MMSLNFDQRPSIMNDRCLEMEYGSDDQPRSQLHSPDFLFTQHDDRPRLNTWPAANFTTDSPDDAPVFDPPMVNGEHQRTVFTISPPQLARSKRTGRNKTGSGSSSPTAKSDRSSPASQHHGLVMGKLQQAPPQRRKLTTHKLSAKSYVDLITEAINSTGERRMTLADIYKWMVANVPCFKQQANVSASSGWKNAVRHTLSLHKRFKRVQRGRLQKPAWWTIQDEGSVVGRSAASAEFTTYPPRRNSEGCFNRIKEEACSPPTSVSSFDIRKHSGGAAISGGGEWSPPQLNMLAAAPAPMYTHNSNSGGLAAAPTSAATWTTAATLPTSYEHSTTASIHPFIREDTSEEDCADSAFGSYVSDGFGGYLIRTQSDASTYGCSPYRSKALTQAYSLSSEFAAAAHHQNIIDEYKPSAALFRSIEPFDGFDSAVYSAMDGYHPHHGGSSHLTASTPRGLAGQPPVFIDECQSVMVQTETGVANINVPMPLRIDVRQQQANQQAQTMLGYAAASGGHQFDQPKLYTATAFQQQPTALPQDLLSVQVDAQVQCNVAEVLAYEMEADPPAVPAEPVNNDLYDLLKAGCTLD